MAKVGRPRRLTKQDKIDICRYLESGLSRKIAARLIKCHLSVILRESQRDEEFGNRLREAEAECERLQLKKIIDSDDWKAAAWFLGRKFPRRWAEVKKLAETDAGGKSLSPEQRKRAIEATLKQRFEKADLVLSEPATVKPEAANGQHNGNGKVKRNGKPPRN